MHALVTFLGRAPGGDDGYRETRYRFEDGSEYVDTLLATALLRRPDAPTRLLVLGTAASMWGHLAERAMTLAAHSETLEEQWTEIHDRARDGMVDQAALDALAEALSATGLAAFDLRLIPDAFDLGGQFELLGILAAATADAHRVDLDVTHGYRHLPMTGLFAAQLLRATRPDLEIGHVWYSFRAAEADAPAPVSDLVGLLDIMRWGEALQRLDLLGDYGAVAPLLHDGRISEALREAGFLELTHQGAVAAPLKRARSMLDAAADADELDPAARLFRDTLTERISWIDGPLETHQRAQAFAALDRGDHLRAALYGLEAFVTKRVLEDEGRHAIGDDKARKGALERYENHSDPGDRRRDALDLVRRLRNRLAHGAMDAERRPAALESEQRLEKDLREALTQLLGPVTGARA